MKYIFLFSFILGISMSGVAQDIDTTTTQWDSIDNDLFKVTYPSSWEVDESGLNGTTLILLTEQNGPLDAFRENINFMIQDLQGQDLSLDQFVEISELQLPQFFKNNAIILSERNTDENREYHKMIYTGEYGALNGRFEQLIWLVAGKAYLLTWTCVVGECDQYQETASKILSNFVLK